MEIRRLTESTGAEAIGVDLTRPVSADARTALNRAFVEHSVLVIRDQALTPAQVLNAGELFGPVFHQHNTRFALPDCPQIHYISNQDHFPDGTRYIPGEGWHTDHSNDTRPPKATVLHAVGVKLLWKGAGEPGGAGSRRHKPRAPSGCHQWPPSVPGIHTPP